MFMFTWEVFPLSDNFSFLFPELVCPCGGGDGEIRAKNKSSHENIEVEIYWGPLKFNCFQISFLKTKEHLWDQSY